MEEIYRQLAENYDIIHFGFAFDKKEFIEKAKGVKVIRKGNFDYPYFNICFLNDMMMQSLQILRDGYVPRIEINHDRHEDGWIDWEDYFFQPLYEYKDYINMLPVVEQREAVYPTWAGLRYEACFQEHERMLAIRLYGELAVINDKCFTYIGQEYQNLIRGKRVLGVLCRGTDMVQAKLKGHPIQPPLEQVIADAGQMMEQLQCQYIYLATEDAGITDRFEREFPGRIIINKRHYLNEAYKSVMREKEQAFLSDVYKKNPSRNFELGLEYLSSIILLSQCQALLAGNCGGSEAALYYNESRYEAWKIYNLGLFP